MCKRQIITNHDLINLNGYSAAAACREMEFIRDSLGKKTYKSKGTSLKKLHQKITVTEYCKFHGFNEDEIRERLGI